MDKIYFYELSQEAHSLAAIKGFWGTRYHIEHYIMLVITELSEAVEAHRSRKRAKWREFRSKTLESGCPDRILFRRSGVITPFSARAFETYIKDTVEDELADTVIRLGDITAAFKVDLKGWLHVGPMLYFSEYDNPDQTFPELVLCIIKELISEKPLEERIPAAVDGVCCLADILGIDLENYIKMKHIYNSGRIFLHGKAY